MAGHSACPLVVITAVPGSRELPTRSSSRPSPLPASTHEPGCVNPPALSSPGVVVRDDCRRAKVNKFVVIRGQVRCAHYRYCIHRSANVRTVSIEGRSWGCGTKPRCRRTASKTRTLGTPLSPVPDGPESARSVDGVHDRDYCASHCCREGDSGCGWRRMDGDLMFVRSPVCLCWTRSERRRADGTGLAGRISAWWRQQ